MWTSCANGRALIATLLVLGAVWAWAEAVPEVSAEKSRAPASSAPTAVPEDAAKADARAKAKLLHEVYALTLESVHHHYFHNVRAVIPARAMEDVFADMERQTKTKARWIAVNARAMSIDHEPRNEVEKQAASALAAGKREFELVEDGYYHRASPIPLGGGCVGCHVGFLAKPSSSPRVAGLVISVPLPAASRD